MYQFLIKGVVQGVGFRPYIYNACKKAGLKGYVQNVGNGVIVEVNNREKFIEILKNVPPLARIDSFEVEETKSEFKDFSIKKSSGQGFAEIPPDLYLCEDCLRELNDPKNRRYNYFFITCTNCGPRFSITKESPYDRCNTTMNEFEMCDACKSEYTDPSNRRYHAQTIACPDCGPKLSLYCNGKKVKGEGIELIKEAVAMIKKGEIVAVKGIGGFHLACNLKQGTAKKLRSITGREHKPYAVMCRDIEMVSEIAEFTEKEKALLESVERPIILLKKKKPLKGITELDTVGVMLPYTALHFLLFRFLKEPIVMTSSNYPNEPITTTLKQQIASFILDHDRRIENAVDDSVLKVVENRVLLLRRSRGFVPRSIPIAKSKKMQLLALGAEMNNTFCVYKNGRAIPSQFLGNTENPAALERYKETIGKFLRFTKTEPQAVIADLHPQYATSLYAIELAEKLRVPVIRVQHHLAHAFSVAAEHSLEDFSSIVCDGLGFGADGTLWGGEVFSGLKRIGHLEPQLQLGGDSAAIFPGKMLFSILCKFLSMKELKKFMPGFKEKELWVMAKQLEQKFNSPVTTSCGRVLDAASFMLGFCEKRTYDGRPAMLLEANSTKPFQLKPVFRKNVLMTTPLFEFLAENYEKDKKRLAATVQEYLARGLYTIAFRVGKPIVFSGGCAYNTIMTSFMVERNVFVNEKVPSGDGGISFGQIAFHLANPGYNFSTRII